MDDATPRATPEQPTNATPHGEDEDELDHDPFLARIAAEDAQSSPADASAAKATSTDIGFYERERDRTRKRRIGLGVTVVIATIVIPFLYLFLSGDLREFRHRQVPSTALKRHQATKSDAQSGGTSNGLTGLDQSALSPLTPAQIAHNKQVKQDLESYLQQGTRTTPDEAVAMKALGAVTGPNFKNNDIALQTLQTTVLPHFSLFLSNISAIHPRTPEMQEIHHTLLESTRLKMLALQHMQEGLRAKDGDQLWQYGFRAELDQSTQFAQDYRTKIVDLATAQGVTLPGT